MASVRVKGQEKLARVARLMEHHGQARTIRRRMGKDIRSASDVITGEQRSALATGLPKRGGAATTITGQARLSTRISLASAKSTGVTIVDSWKGHNMPAIDQGTLRHPLWGNRRFWFITSIRPGLLSRPVERNRRRVQVAIIRTLDALADEIARGI